MKSTRGSLIFTLLVAAYAIAVLVETLTLSPVARLVPLWVLGPILVLLGLELALAIAPSLAARWAFLEKHDYFDTQKLLERGLSVTGLGPDGRHNTGVVLGWYGLLLVLVLCLDLRLALCLDTFGYARLRGHESFVVSLLMGIAMGAVAHGARWLLEGG